VPAACLLGPYPVPVEAVFKALWPGGGDGLDPALRRVVLDLRLARALLAWLTGASLAVSGAVFQGLLRNPLADPFTLGVSTGAAFGAALAIALGLSGGLWAGVGFLPPAALLGALGALAAVLLVSRGLGGGLRRETLVLAGIVVSTFLSALISLVKALDEASVTGIVFWILGSFQGRGWAHVALFAPYAALGLGAAWLLARDLDLLCLGETQARLLGVHAGRSRLILLCAASLSAAAAVSVSGVIGFVGLVAPHGARLVLGAEHRTLLLGSALAGGLLLVGADALARTILPGGAELPVGVLTALIGGPFFCLLLRRRARGVE
jgi:iron complex transport system permease protein